MIHPCTDDAVQFLKKRTTLGKNTSTPLNVLLYFIGEDARWYDILIALDHMELGHLRLTSRIFTLDTTVSHAIEELHTINEWDSSLTIHGIRFIK